MVFLHKMLLSAALTQFWHYVAHLVTLFVPSKFLPAAPKPRFKIFRSQLAAPKCWIKESTAISGLRAHRDLPERLCLA